MADASIRSVVDEILNEPDIAESVDESVARRALDESKLYGVVSMPEKQYGLFSIINWREDYIRKFTTTAVIGYIFRMFAEYKKSYTGLDENKPDFAEKDSLKTFTFAEIEKFLKRNFEFNPDIHLESAYKENLKDPKRVERYGEMREKMQNPAESDDFSNFAADFEQLLNFAEGKGERPNVAEIRSRYKNLAANTRDLVSQTYNLAHETRQVCLKINNQITNLAEGKSEEFSAEDFRMISLKNASHLKDTIAALHFGTNQTHPFHFGDVAEVYRNVPPVDLSHHFDRYARNHFEQLREATELLYSTRPDIEFGIQFYGAYKNADRATEEYRKIEKSVIASVVIAENESWTLLGPFKENREAINFYNQNTGIMEEMFKQAKNDTELGTKLFKERAKNAKKKNVLEAGPDDPGLEQYKKDLDIVSRFGKKSELSKEEQDEYHAALARKEQAEVPEDTVQSKVFHTDKDGNFTSKNIYINAEAPQQPTQPNVTSRKGERMNLEALKSKIKPENDNIE